MTGWRRRWGLFLNGLLGTRCTITGDRVFPTDRDTHQNTQHPTDGRCVTW